MHTEGPEELLKTPMPSPSAARDPDSRPGDLTLVSPNIPRVILWCGQS